MLVDQKAREDAVNPNYSCLVNAPAGSGKTSLIIKRVMNLIAVCSHPSQITVLTFTRAATEEIKTRIKIALLASQKDVSIVQQLKIFTYDEWGMRLLGQIAPQQVFKIHPNPKGLYQSAYERYLLANHTNDENPFTAILKDNLAIYTQLEATFIRLLAKRDQWLPLVMQGNQEWMYKQWEITFQDIAGRIKNIMRAHLNSLATIAEEYCVDDTVDFTDLNPSTLAAIAKWMLTLSGSIRHPTIKMGFPAGKNSKECTDKAVYKDIKAFIETNNELLSYWQFIQSYSSEAQQSFTEQLTQMLPELLAHLKVIFNEKNQSDHCENALNLLAVLNEEQHHPELRHTQHLLLDEFQDTSPLQFALLGQFVKEWSNDGQSSIFIVGDPMQSIYGFRNADVRLILDIGDKQRFHHMHIKTYSLQCNFRSAAKIVDFSNDIFSSIMPQSLNINWCSLPFNPSIAISDSIGAIDEYTVLPDNTLEQLKTIIEKNPSQEIGILVVTRQQGHDISRYLNHFGIECDQSNIQNILDDPLCYDIICLFSAIHRPFCNIAWAALCQTAWLGIDFDNMKNMSQSGDIRSALFNTNDSNIDGFISQIKETMQSNASSWEQFIEVLNTINPSIVHLQKLQTLLEYLSSLDSQQTYLPHLLDGVESLRLESTPHNCAITITTIHQSKGLEYDHVILPYLNSKTRAMIPEILEWDTWILQNSSLPAILLASGLDGKNLIDPLMQVSKAKHQQERKRLLYVALTRAKNKISLIYNKKPSAGSFQHMIGPTISEEIAP